MPDTIEYVVDVVSEQAANELLLMKGIFSPDGRRVGEKKLTSDQQIIQYKLEILDDPQGWLRWAWTVYDSIETKLASVPYDVREEKRIGEERVREFALALAISYKKRMDALVQKKLSATMGDEAPVVVPNEEGDDYGRPDQ